MTYYRMSVLILTFAALNIDAAFVRSEPLQDRYDVAGMGENGELCDSVTIYPHEKTRLLGIRIPDIAGGRRRLPSYQLSINDGGKTAYLGLSLNGSASGNALHSAGMHRYRCTTGDVFPIYDELYRVRVNSGSLEIERVTASAPTDAKPSPGSRTIACNAASDPLFWNPRANTKGWIRVDRIENGKVPKAFVTISPPAGKDEIAKDRKGIDFTAAVKPGDCVSTEFQSYRIVKIVPAQPFDPKDENAGRLIGWIEIDPEPLPSR